MIPSISWTVMMYFGSDATGRLWYFKPQINGNESNSIVAFQDIQEHERLNVSKAVVITTACLLALQLTLTLYFCAKISMTSLRSTLSVALRGGLNEEFELKDLHGFKDNKDRENEPPCIRIERQLSVQRFAESVLNQMLKREGKCSNEPDLDKDTNCDGKGLENKDNTSNVNVQGKIKANTQSDSEQANKGDVDASPYRDDKDPDAIFTISSEIVQSNDDGPLSTDLFRLPKKDLNSSISEEDVIILSKLNSDISKTKRISKRRNKVLIPKVNDYKTVVPISGAKLVHIPLTSAVICVSRKDIICSTSLILQVLCLLITYILSFTGFNISGKVVSLERYIWSIRFTELSLLMITMVDPIVCMIFSSNYRRAARNIVRYGRSD